MLSRSPESARARLRDGVEPTPLSVPCNAACDGRGTSPVRIASSHAASLVRSGRYGLQPVSSSYSTTPSEYTSVIVLTGSPRICSGAA